MQRFNIVVPAVLFLITTLMSGISYSETAPVDMKMQIDKLNESIQKIQINNKSDMDEYLNKYKKLIELEADKKVIDKAEEKEKASVKEFAGFNWGVGLAYTYINKGPSIDEAEMVDGKVRIKKEHNRAAALMLETHYFVNLGKFQDSEIGLGPFAAIRVIDTEGKDVKAYGVGIMAGFKRQQESKSSWNIGIGYYVDTSVKQLGSGITEGEALPGTEKEIRYKQVDSGGFMFMLSATL